MPMTHIEQSARRMLVACLGALFLVASLGAVETLAQRRRRVEAMPPEQLEELFRCEKEFRDLPPEERQRIQNLHDQIESAPDRDVLRATMNRYCKWFEMQPLIRRAKLRDKKNSPTELLAMVEKFRQDQKDSGKDLRLDNKNRRALTAWVDRYVTEHAPRSDQQQAIAREMFLRRLQAPGPMGQLPIAEPDLDRLRADLTPELRTNLAGRDPAEQRKIIRGWLRETASRELDERLADFFNSMDIADRDQLMSLPGDEMYDTLSREYRAQMQMQTKAGDPQHRNDPSRRNDRAWPRGRHPGPRGSGDRHLPKDNADGEPGREPPPSPRSSS
jgi:hypothetical protein